MINKPTWIFLLFLLIPGLSGCNTIISNPAPLKAALLAVSDTTKDFAYILNCESIITIPIGNEINEFELIDPDIESFNPPIFLTIDEENRIYLDDQANGRIFIYDENYDLISIVNVPSYRPEDTNLFRLPIWVGVIASQDRIFLLLNPVFTEGFHGLVSVIDTNGTELALLDLSVFTGVASDGYLNQVSFPWDFIRLFSDGQGGVFTRAAFPYLIHINNDMQLANVRPSFTVSVWYLSFTSGWDGYLYFQNNEDLIFQTNIELNQLNNPINLLNRVSQYGIEELSVSGVDQNGNIYFTSQIGDYDTGTHIIGRYDPQNEEIWVASLTATMENGFQVDLRNIEIAPDGTIYTFDDTNWPASRDLLRCEFMPHP